MPIALPPALHTTPQTARPRKHPAQHPRKRYRSAAPTAPPPNPSPADGTAAYSPSPDPTPATHIPRWAAAYLHRMACRGYALTPTRARNHCLSVEIYITSAAHEHPHYAWRCCLPQRTARLLARCMRKRLQRKLPQHSWHLLLVNPETQQILARREALPQVPGPRPCAAPAAWLRRAARQRQPTPAEPALYCLPPNRRCHLPYRRLRISY